MELGHVGIDHVGVWPAQALDAVRAEPGVGGIALPGGALGHHGHHLIGVAGGGADGDPLGPEGLHGLHHPGLGGGVVRQALHEGVLKDAIDLLHGGLVGGPLVLLPLPLDGGHGQHGADVVPLEHAHGGADLLHGGVHPELLEGQGKGVDRGEAAVVHGGARPVKDDELGFHFLATSWRKSATMALSLTMSSG